MITISLRPEEAVLGHCKIAGSAGPGAGSCTVLVLQQHRIVEPSSWITRWKMGSECRTCAHTINREEAESAHRSDFQVGGVSVQLAGS